MIFIKQRILVKRPQTWLQLKLPLSLQMTSVNIAHFISDADGTTSISF